MTNTEILELERKVREHLQAVLPSDTLRVEQETWANDIMDGYLVQPGSHRRKFVFRVRVRYGDELQNFNWRPVGLKLKTPTKNFVTTKTGDFSAAAYAHLVEMWPRWYEEWQTEMTGRTAQAAAQVQLDEITSRYPDPTLGFRLLNPTEVRVHKDVALADLEALLNRIAL